MTPIVILLFADVQAGDAAWLAGIAATAGAVIGAFSTAAINWVQRRYDISKDATAVTVEQYQKIVQRYEAEVEKLEKKCEERERQLFDSRNHMYRCEQVLREHGLWKDDATSGTALGGEL